jgi:hypothetical protein
MNKETPAVNLDVPRSLCWIENLAGPASPCSSEKRQPTIASIRSTPIYHKSSEMLTTTGGFKTKDGSSKPWLVTAVTAFIAATNLVDLAGEESPAMSVNFQTV